MTTTANKKTHDRIAFWKDNPVDFVRECFSVDPDMWQIDFLNNYRGLAPGAKKRSGAKACKGPGKTTALAWACWHFLTCFMYPKIAATSISGDNLRDGLWSEMAKWQSRSPFHLAAFQWTATRISSKEHPEMWYMSARSWAQTANKEQQANTLAGLHADNMMFVIDEAGGVPDAVMVAAEAALSTVGGTKRLLITGNPTHLSGPLYRACTSEASHWEMIEITGDPDDPKRSPRIDIEWARKQISSYGADNAWVLVNVFGKFPPASMDALLGPDEVQAAMERFLDESQYIHMPKILGVDVGGQGADSTTICPRQGLVCFKPKIYRLPDTVQVAGRVAQAINKWNPDGVFVDGTGGWGMGVVNTLRDWGYAVTDVQFSGAPMDMQFANKRAEMTWLFAQWIKSGGCLPNLPELKEEATAQVSIFKKDKIQIIDKDIIKAQIGRSPDLWDGYMTTFAFPVAKKDPLEQYRRPHVRHDYSPMLGLVNREGGADTGQEYDPIGGNAFK